MLRGKRMKVSFRGKRYIIIQRPAILYEAETWMSKKSQEKKINVSEMKMLR